MPFSDWVEQRRNLAINPRMVTLPGAGYGSQSLSLVSVSDNPDGIATAVRVTYGSNANNPGVIFDSVPILPNTTYTVSAWVKFETFGSTGSSAFAQVSVKASPAQPLSGETAGVWVRRSWTYTTDGNTQNFGFRVAGSATAGSFLITGVLLELVDTLGNWFDGYTDPDGMLERTSWVSTVGHSQSVVQTRMHIAPEPVIPIRDLTTSDVLYGDRVTTYRWEVLEHSNGIDQLVGTLDGVSSGSLDWTQNVAVKGGGKVTVVDLDVAKAGMLRVADLSLESVRLRPVCSIVGLPENPLGVFLVSAAREEWEDTGRVWSMELLDRCTVPDQDVVEESYAVAAGTLILHEVQTILASCNEYMAIDQTNTQTTSSNMVWEAGTSKLKIINDLLDVANYNALWMDGYGNFQATPRVLPADRSILYEALGFPRELRDGELSIYRPDWTRDRDSFDVPNKVIAVQAAGGEDEEALVGVWTNEDSSSPYSYQARGRWVPHVLDSVETPEGTPEETVAFLEKRAQTTLVQMSAVQAQVKIEHLPIPVRVSDVIRFSHTKAGVDARHTITKLHLDTTPLGLMKSTLQEVISL